jgi:hypothetical protein
MRRFACSPWALFSLSVSDRCGHGDMRGWWADRDLPAWFIASVLPLPPQPRLSSKEPEKRLSRLEIERDLEKALGVAGGARYENARWWRNLNRGMSVLGVLILAAIVSAPRKLP